MTLFAGGMLLFFGATPVLYGVAMLGSDDYPSRLGWVGVVFGSASVVAGAIQVFTGFTTTFFIVLFPIVSVGYYVVDHLHRGCDGAEVGAGVKLRPVV